ncbi:MAG: hypothetical protein SF069_03060 [Phycisphaerae bacterium]|nr:hypothetical protein [Phycisphaerae bacterium]
MSLDRKAPLPLASHPQRWLVTLVSAVAEPGAQPQHYAVEVYGSEADLCERVAPQLRNMVRTAQVSLSDADYVVKLSIVEIAAQPSLLLQDLPACVSASSLRALEHAISCLPAIWPVPVASITHQPSVSSPVGQGSAFAAPPARVAQTAGVA